MSKIVMKFISENENIEYKDELQNHISKRFYKRLRYLNATFYKNDEECNASTFLTIGDTLTILYEEKEEMKDWPLYEAKLDIFYEDVYYLIVNKKSGLLSIPTKGEPRSLYQEALYYLNQKEEISSISILNRLDRDTKGLVVIAKSKLAAYYLQPTHEKMIRKYLCLCHGIFEQKEGTITTFIDKIGDSHKRIISENHGKLAVSKYKVVEEFKDKSLVQFELQTGRTHQIRLHCKYIAHPIVGDSLYGIDEEEEFHLCSSYVEFSHPFTGEKIKIEIESGWESGRIK